MAQLLINLMDGDFVVIIKSVKKIKKRLEIKTETITLHKHTN